MVKKEVTRPHYTSDVPDLYFGDEFDDVPVLDFEVLERNAGYIFNNETREKIKYITGKYIYNLGVEVVPVRDVRSCLVKMQEACFFLRTCLDHAIDEGNKNIALDAASFATYPSQALRLLEDLEEWQERIEQELDEEVPKSRTKNEVLEKFIKQLHEIYINAGGSGVGAYFDNGSGEPKGQFYNLVFSLLEQAQQTPQRITLCNSIMKIMR